MKVWQDGEVRQKETGEARLLSEQGEIISTSKAKKASLQPFAEGSPWQSKALIQRVTTESDNTLSKDSLQTSELNTQAQVPRRSVLL